MKFLNHTNSEVLKSLVLIPRTLLQNHLTDMIWNKWALLWMRQFINAIYMALIIRVTAMKEGFPDSAVVKNPPANARDARQVGSIPGSRRSPGEGNGNPLQYFHLGNLMDRGAWPATVHGVAKTQTWQSMHECHEGTYHPRQTRLALVKVKNSQQVDRHH